MCARSTSSKLSSPMTSCCCQGGPFSESLERRGSTEHTLSQNLLQRYRERERAELPSFLLPNDKYFCLFNQSSVGLSLSWSNTQVFHYLTLLVLFKISRYRFVFVPARQRKGKKTFGHQLLWRTMFLFIYIPDMSIVKKTFLSSL